MVSFLSISTLSNIHYISFSQKYDFPSQIVFFSWTNKKIFLSEDAYLRKKNQNRIVSLYLMLFLGRKNIYYYQKHEMISRCLISFCFNFNSNLPSAIGLRLTMMQIYLYQYWTVAKKKKKGRSAPRPNYYF